MKVFRSLTVLTGRLLSDSLWSDFDSVPVAALYAFWHPLLPTLSSTCSKDRLPFSEFLSEQNLVDMKKASKCYSETFRTLPLDLRAVEMSCCYWGVKRNSKWIVLFCWCRPGKDFHHWHCFARLGATFLLVSAPRHPKVRLLPASLAQFYSPSICYTSNRYEGH